MFKHAAAALLAGTILFPVAASAQDSAPFTGVRVEAIAGYDSFRSDGGEIVGDTNAAEEDESIDSVAYGIGAGFDFNLGGLVVGIEGEYLDTIAEQEFSDEIDGDAFEGSVGIGRDIYIGGRVGFTVSPRTLVYAKAGYTNTAIDTAFTDADDETFNFDTTIDGWRLGAGVEAMLGTNAFVKAEYRFSNYSGLQFDDELFEDEDLDIDLDRHQVVGGIGIRF